MSEQGMQSPLHGLDLAARATPKDARSGAYASELPLAAFISLRGHASDPDFVAAASKALGLELPVTPCTLAALGGAGQRLAALWLSPDEWMIVAPRACKARLLAALSEGLQATPSHALDNSGGYTQILLEGPSAADVLTHTTVYDVRSLAADRVVGTTFGKSSVYLRREGEGYVLLVRRSFADYVWRYLERAAIPYGFAVVSGQRNGTP